ncbi:MAG: G5 domain-containing protein [Candidatus Berkelbacteria bacterium]
MRNFFYAVVFISLIGFGSFSVLKSQAQEVGSYKLQVASYPYQISEIKPSGGKNTISGVSSSIDPIKIIPDLKVAYYPEDKISTFPDPKLGFGSTIKIERAPVISVRDGKRSKQYRSWMITAGELFTEKGIEIGTDDKVSVSLGAQIFDGSTVSITRVAITNVVDTRPIDFAVQEKEDSNLDYGKKRVDSGIKGEKKLTYRVTREDGDEVSRVLLTTEITKQPKTQINYTGTKVTVLSSVRGTATIGPKQCSVVSANYKAGTLVRITNSANGVKVFGTVDCTWGTATAPPGIVLDLSMSVLSSLKWNGLGAGPSVLVEEIKR